MRLADGERVQVKTRVVSVPARAGQRQTSPFRSWDFDTAAFVLLGAEDYHVMRASMLPIAVVKKLAHRRAHINGDVVMMNGTLLGHSQATDITVV